MATISPKPLLQYALERLGPREVARRLGVADGVVRFWLANPDEMPDPARVSLADLIDQLTDPGFKK